jgi:hypothetical protein
MMVVLEVVLNYIGGGGGGASAVGLSNSSGSTAGAGGAGTASSITGSSITRAGGGGGTCMNLEHWRLQQVELEVVVNGGLKVQYWWCWYSKYWLWRRWRWKELVLTGGAGGKGVVILSMPDLQNFQEQQQALQQNQMMEQLKF